MQEMGRLVVEDRHRVCPGRPVCGRPVGSGGLEAEAAVREGEMCGSEGCCRQGAWLEELGQGLGDGGVLIGGEVRGSGGREVA